MILTDYIKMMSLKRKKKNTYFTHQDVFSVYQIKLQVYYLDKIVVNLYHKLSVQKENQKDMFTNLSVWLYVSFMNLSIGIFLFIFHLYI